MWDGVAVQLFDPRELLLDGNPRTITDIADEEPELVASIAEHGVLLPVIANPTEDGMVRVKDGFSRVLAAILHVDTHPTVPVLVTDASDESAWQRLVDQWIANEHRRGFTAADKAKALEQLSLFGLSNEEIATKLATTTEEVEAGLRVRRSAKAAEVLAEHPQLDMLQAAAFAEFDDDENALQGLRETLESQADQLEHELARLRQNRLHMRLRDTKIAELAEQGVVVVGEYDGEFTPLYRLLGTDNVELTEETHGDCPGRVAKVRVNYDDTLHVRHGCSDPKKHGHTDCYSSTLTSTDARSGRKTEEEKADARRVRENNKAWRAALSVRRKWLAGFLQRTTPPKHLHLQLLIALAESHDHLRDGIGLNTAYACKLMGLKQPAAGRKHPMAAKAARANTNQLQLMTLAIVLAAFEQHYDKDYTVNTWRSPRTDDRLYLRMIAEWGYPLSTVEQLVLDPAADAKDWPHLAEEASGTDGPEDEAAAA